MGPGTQHVIIGHHLSELPVSYAFCHSRNNILSSYGYQVIVS